MNMVTISAQESSVSFTGGLTALNLREIRTNDNILIWTRNGLYSFLVTDAEHRRGKLLCCSREDRSAEAILVGMTGREGKELPAIQSELRTDSRALFLMPDAGQMKQLVTSAITRMVVIK
ncbi:MAG TPA: hypothetical protein VNO70_09695 [Blastocatellia bacterium]|nr:hypothetical protein [Blastocatellia bacterium]